MTKLIRTVFPALLLSAAMLSSVHAAPAAADAAQVEIKLVDSTQPAAQLAANADEAEMSERLDPLTIAGISGAIVLYSLVSALRRRRTEQEVCPKPV
jgi:uncharacterized BrkB/YihY/UPF0761 family membrane protein